MSSLEQLLIGIFIFVVGGFGLFGNVSILYGTLTNSHLHTKCGILIGIASGNDIINILSEMINAITSSFNIQVSRLTCLYMMGLYIVTIEFEVFLMFSIAIDRLICLVFPLRYLALNTFYYVLFFVVFSFIPGVILIILNLIEKSNNPVEFCNPVEAQGGINVYIWNLSTQITNLAIIIIYIILFILLKRKMNCQDSRTDSSLSQYIVVIRTIIVMALTFCCTWCAAHSMVSISLFGNISKETSILLGALGVIPAMLCYSVNYFIFFTRSSEYRRIFKRQLALICPCLKGKALVDGNTQIITITRKKLTKNHKSDLNK
uniref:G_PROTEIN_RECEP_F1_2 domain-containing protein n=1 Tax=Parastrongyloides trichosuri TaxID=131310 RepID=A0A0N4ZXZ0_PARTI